MKLITISNKLLTSQRTRLPAVKRPFSSLPDGEKIVSSSVAGGTEGRSNPPELLAVLVERVLGFIVGSANLDKPFIMDSKCKQDGNLRWVFKGRKRKDLERAVKQIPVYVVGAENYYPSPRLATPTPPQLTSSQTDPTESEIITSTLLGSKTLEEYCKRAGLIYDEVRQQKINQGEVNLHGLYDWRILEINNGRKIVWNVFQESTKLPTSPEDRRWIPVWTYESRKVLLPMARKVLRLVGFQDITGPWRSDAPWTERKPPASPWELPPEKTNLKLLPNIRKMELGTYKLWDPLFNYFGISTKDSQKVNLWGWRNRKANKYLYSQYSRLMTYRGASTNKLKRLYSPTGKYNAQASRYPKPNLKYWNHAYFLLRHSLIFRTVYFNHTFPNWEKYMSLDVCLKILERVETLVRSGRWTRLQLTRVWIDGDKRPLGVPAKAHRVIGAQLSALMEFYIKGSISENHAYQYRKGTGTAWTHILNNLIRIKGRGHGWPYIYEYDISGFFNNLSHAKVIAVLKGIGVPAWLWLGILELQTTAPKVPKPGQSDTVASLRSRLVDKAERVRLKRSHTGGPWLQFTEDSSARSTKCFYYEGPYNRKGVAQGHNLSPLLSILVLDLALQMWKSRSRSAGYETEIVQYADDGILCSTGPEPIEWFGSILKEITGCDLSKSKSHWVRRNWVYERVIKFLGLIFDPFKEQLKASTRKGSKVILESSFTEFLGEFHDGSERVLHTVEGQFMYEPYQLGEVRKQEVYLRNETQRTTTLTGTFFSSTSPGGRYRGEGWVFGNWLGNIRRIHLRQQVITWRSVMKASRLNQFMARLYFGSLSDQRVEQNFKLEPAPRSLIGYLQNSLTLETVKVQTGRWSLAWPQGSWQFLESKGVKAKAKLEWILGREYYGLWKLESDLEHRLTTFNSSSVGTYLLPYALRAQRKRITQKGITLRQLFQKQLSKLNLGGYWCIDELSTPKVDNGHCVDSSNPSRKGRDAWHQGYMLKKLGKTYSRLAWELDWFSAYTVYRWQNLGGDRIREAKSYWSETKLSITRNYARYRVARRYSDEEGRYISLGWLPVRPRRPKGSASATLENPNNPVSFTEHPYLSTLPRDEVVYDSSYRNGGYTTSTIRGYPPAPTKALQWELVGVRIDLFLGLDLPEDLKSFWKERAALHKGPKKKQIPLHVNWANGWYKPYQGESQVIVGSFRKLDSFELGRLRVYEAPVMKEPLSKIESITPASPNLSSIWRAEAVVKATHDVPIAGQYNSSQTSLNLYKEQLERGIGWYAGDSFRVYLDTEGRDTSQLTSVNDLFNSDDVTQYLLAEINEAGYEFPNDASRQNALNHLLLSWQSHPWWPKGENKTGSQEEFLCQLQEVYPKLRNSAALKSSELWPETAKPGWLEDHFRNLLLKDRGRLDADGTENEGPTREETANPSDLLGSLDPAVWTTQIGKVTYLTSKDEAQEKFNANSALDRVAPLGDFYEGYSGTGYDPIPHKPKPETAGEETYGTLPKINCPMGCTRGCEGPRGSNGERYCVGPWKKTN